MKQRSEADAVLSSVRQLVSRELRDLSGANPPESTEKLLLTPALRVDARPSQSPSRPAAPVRERSALELRIAELEKAVSGVAGDWEPDGSEPGDAETPKRFVFHHAAREQEAAWTKLASEARLEDNFQFGTATPPPASPVAETRAEAADRGPDDGADIVQVFDGTEIDEEHLREIVAEMVRAELQGELGERITRNVRKLVRREIHQALLTRDLD